MTTQAAIRRLFYKLVAAGLLDNTEAEFRALWKECRS